MAVKSIKNKDKRIHVKGYIRHWIEDLPNGHRFKILTDKGLLTIDCSWPDRVRSNSGRVINKYLK